MFLVGAKRDMTMPTLKAIEIQNPDGSRTFEVQVRHDTLTVEQIVQALQRYHPNDGHTAERVQVERARFNGFWPHEVWVFLGHFASPSSVERTLKKLWGKAHLEEVTRLATASPTSWNGKWEDA